MGRPRTGPGPLINYNASAIVTAGPYVLASVSRVLSDDAEGTALFSGPAPWGITTEQSLSPTRSYADSPGANHANNLNVALTQIGQTALTSVPGALTFQLRTDLHANFDFILAEISADNGATWTEVFRQTGITPWSLYSRSLAAWTGKTIKVRFRLVTDATVTLSGVWLDDIRISVPTAPGSCPLQDTVEGTPAFTGAGTWAVTTEQSFSPTHSYSDSPGASYANDANTTLTQSGSTNLSSLAAPQLEFLARTRLEAGFDFLLAEVSYDNAVSWLPVVKLTGDREWTLITAPLAPGATTRLRFRLNTNSSTVSDGVWIDDVRICGEGCVAIPPSLVASPTSVTAGANITVQYHAPNAASTLDWIGLYKVGDPDSAYKWYAYTQGAFSGSFTTSAPAAAGNYEFRYFTNGVAGPRAFSNAVAVVAPSYSVTGSPSTAPVGSGLTCNWTAPSGHAGTDWVGLFRVGEPDSAYLQWLYLGSAASGSFTSFTAPSPPGNYEFRIIGAGGAGRVAVSNPITVTAGASAYTITPGATTIAAGAALSVAWTAPAGHSPFEWIALYRVGDPNSAYGWWSYLGSDASGSFNLTAPSTTGSYEFRIIRVNGATAETSTGITVTAAYTITPGAATVAAGAALSVSWTAPVGHGPFEWIGLFRVGDPNSAYGWWSYLGTPTSATFNLTAPETTGDYEFRIIRSNGTEGARSTTVTVTAPTGGSYTITPGAATVVAGAALGVAWTAPAGHSTADWLALVPKDAPNSSYRWFQYLPAGTSGSFSLTAPLMHGTYEFRIIRNTGVTAVTSTVVTITPAYTITPGSATVPVGGTVSVSWTAPAGHSTGDWIGFFRVGDPNSAYFWFGYLPATTSGSFMFSAPQTPGDYEFRIFAANVEVARSTKVTVTPVTGAYTATPGATTVAAGAALGVAWTAPAGHPANDAIGLCPVGQGGSVWSMNLGTGTSGSFNLTAPTTPGNYEFRIVLGNNGTTAVTSVTIAVTGVYTITPGQTMVAPGGALTVSWTAPAGHPAADYIALFRVGDPNSQITLFISHLGSATSGSFTNFAAPATPGDYEYRIIRENTTTDVARSTKITVQ